MYDRYAPKKTRERQAEAIVADNCQSIELTGFNKKFQAEKLLLKLEELLSRPNCTFAPPPWAEDFIRLMKSGHVNKLMFMKVRSLEIALGWQERDFIGPIQRFPKKPMTNATRQWRANRVALESMQAARPLRPPGR